LGLGIAIYAAIGSLTWPLGPDQALFNYVGNVILDGGVPYRDAWDIKGPLTYYLYALAMGIFGRRAISIRILDLIVVVPFCWLLRRLVLRLNGNDAFGATSATILFALLYYDLSLWGTAQPDEWGGMLILVAVTLLLDPPWKSHWTMAAVGGLIALATLLKPTFLIFLLLPMLYPVRDPIQEPYRVRSLTACMLALVLTIATLLLVLFSLGGGLRDYVDVLHYIVASHLPSRHFFTELAALPQVLFRLGLLIPLLLAPIGIRVLRLGGMRRQASIMAGWLVLAILLVCIQGRYWSYHWLSADIALAVSLGIAFTWFGRHLKTQRPTLLRTKAVTLLICLSAMAQLGGRALAGTYEWVSYVFGLQERKQYITHLTETYGWDYWACQSVSAYIVDHSDPNDRVLIWGLDVLVNVLSHRKSPTRFAISLPLVAEGPLRTKYRQLFMQEITMLPPRYIVVDAGDSWALVDRPGLELLNDFPEFSLFVQSRYVLVTKVDTFELWSFAR